MSVKEEGERSEDGTMNQGKVLCLFSFGFGVRGVSYNNEKYYKVSII